MPVTCVQIYEGGRGLGFHFDKDEHAMAQEGRMVNPILSSVLYLTGSRRDSLRQARPLCSAPPCRAASPGFPGRSHGVASACIPARPP